VYLKCKGFPFAFFYKQNHCCPYTGHSPLFTAYIIFPFEPIPLDNVKRRKVVPVIKHHVIEAYGGVEVKLLLAFPTVGGAGSVARTKFFTPVYEYIVSLIKKITYS
jgi:hypothetical protein